MAVLYVYGLFFVSKWLELRSVFRTLLPQQSKLWFSFLCRGVKNNQEVWVNVQRLIWRKGNHLSPLEFGDVYHETECKKKKENTLADEGKVKISYFFLPCFAHRSKLRPGEVFFFTLARVFCRCDWQVRHKPSLSGSRVGDYEGLMKTATAGINHAWCWIAPSRPPDTCETLEARSTRCFLYAAPRVVPITCLSRWL